MSDYDSSSSNSSSSYSDPSESYGARQVSSTASHLPPSKRQRLTRPPSSEDEDSEAVYDRHGAVVLVPIPVLRVPPRDPRHLESDDEDEEMFISDPLLQGHVDNEFDKDGADPPVVRGFEELNRDFKRACNVFDRSLIPSVTDGLSERTLAELASTVHSRYQLPSNMCDPNRLGTGWIDGMQQFEKLLAKKEAIEKERSRMVSCLEYSSDPNRFLNVCDGDTRLRNIMEMLDSYGYTRSHTQKIFHFWALQALLPKIYGKQWDAVSIRVLREHGLRKVHHEVMKMTPRRFGKTWGVAMFVVAALMNIPGLQIAIFSTGGRASKGMMDIIKMFLYSLPQHQVRRVVKQSFEELHIAAHPLSPGAGPASGEAIRKQSLSTTSKLKTYPSNPQGILYIIRHRSKVGVRGSGV